MGGNQHFILTPPRQHYFSVCEMPLGQRGIDTHVVLFVRQAEQLMVTETEPPALLVVGGPVGNPVRMVGKCMQVLLQLGEAHSSAYGAAIPDYMEVRLQEVDNPLSSQVHYIGVADIPLQRDGPIKYRRAAGHLMDVEWNASLNASQRLPYALACDTSTEGKQFGHQAMHGLPRLL